MIKNKNLLLWKPTLINLSFNQSSINLVILDINFLSKILAFETFCLQNLVSSDVKSNLGAVCLV